MRSKSIITVPCQLYKYFVWQVLFLSFTVSLWGQNVNLFEHQNATQTQWGNMQVDDIQRSEISINDSALESLRNGDIREFEIPLFDGQTKTVIVQRIIEHLEGDWSLTGWINGNWKSSFILSYSDGEILTSISNIDEHQFLEIQYERQLMNHVLVEIDPHQRDDLECGIHHDLQNVPEEDQSDTKALYQQLENTSETVVDVMIVYTLQAMNWANASDSGINNVINQAMAKSQVSADNSGLNLRFRLVHRALVNYSESGSTSIDLRNLTFGSIAGVRTMRDQYGADLVSMFTYTNDAGGSTWAMFSTNGSPSHGYSIIRVQQASWTTSLAHELGHNFGNHHSRNQYSSPAPSSGGLYSFSTGWRWRGNDGRSYASVMTYPQSSTRVDVFSNPNVTYAGTPTGSYSGAYAPADNARSMELMKNVIAGYRPTRVFTSPPTVATSSITNISFVSAQGGGNVTNDGGRAVTSRGICWSISQNPDFSDTCQSSGSGTGSFSIAMNNLSINTMYYVRAYATNAEGSSFGDQLSFKTLEIAVDPGQSTIATNTGKVQANNQNSAEITVIARDFRGLRLAGFNTSLVATQGSLQSSPQIVATNSEGLARFNVTNSKVEQVTYSAVSGGVRLVSTVQVRFIGIDAQLSSLEMDNHVVQADGITAARLMVVARDEDNALFSNAEIEISSSSNTTSIQSVCKVTDENGIALFDVTNTVSEKVTYSASTLGTTINQTATVNFIPVAPVALAASQVKTRSFKANWELVNGANGYQLDVATDSTFSSMVQGYESISTANTTTYEVSGLSAGTDYFYRVRAKVGDLIGANSDTIFTITYPEIPVALAASDHNALQFKANWQSADGARNYRIDVALDEEFEIISQNYDDLEISNQTSVEINNLQPGTDYHYRVRSQAGFRLSEYSNLMNTSTLSISAEQSRIEQQQLRILANGAQTNEINFTVKSDNGTALKELQVVLVPDSWQAAEDYPTTLTDENGMAQFALSSLTPGIVNYRVEAHKTHVGEFQIEYLAVEGIVVLGNNYPNPFQQKTILPVTVPSTMPIEIRVYDILGQPVQTVINEVVESGYYEVPFMAYDLASGVYFYRLFVNGKILTERMVKVN